MANVPHSTLVGTNLHWNMGDSRSARAWTLAAGTTNALLIENSNNNDFLRIDTSTTPGSSSIILGNLTDQPSMDLQGFTRVLGPTSGGAIFTVSTNAGTDTVLRVIAAGAGGPHTVAIRYATMQIQELAADPTAVADCGLLYTKDVATVTHLFYRASGGTVYQLTPAGGTGDVVGPASATDNAIARFDTTTGKLIQNSAVTISDIGDFSIGSTGQVISWATATTFAIGGGSHGTLAGTNSTVVGTGAQTGSSDATAIGGSANASGAAATCVGRTAAAAGSGTALGYGANAGHSAGLALGRAATTTAANQCVIGGDAFGVTDVYIGQGVTDAAPDALVTLQATGGSGTNIAASALRIAAGKGTGNSATSILYLATSDPGSTGSTLQTLVDRVAIGGSSTSMGMYLGNPDADGIVAAPVATVTVAATSSNSGTAASAFVVQAGNNFSTGNAGAMTVKAGSTTGAGTGADLILEAGNSSSSTGGTLRLRTGQTASAIDRLTIRPTGELDVAAVTGGSATVNTIIPAVRVTHTGTTAQDVWTLAIPSDRTAYLDVKAVWQRTTATKGWATASVFGGCRNDAGTTDEIGGSTIVGTIGTREGSALTDLVSIQLVADNTTDEIKIQLTKNNSNDYQVDLWINAHVT